MILLENRKTKWEYFKEGAELFLKLVTVVIAGIGLYYSLQTVKNAVNSYKVSKESSNEVIRQNEKDNYIETQAKERQARSDKLLVAIQKYSKAEYAYRHDNIPSNSSFEDIIVNLYNTRMEVLAYLSDDNEYHKDIEKMLNRVKTGEDPYTEGIHFFAEDETISKYFKEERQKVVEDLEKIGQ